MSGRVQSIALSDSSAVGASPARADRASVPPQPRTPGGPAPRRRRRPSRRSRPSGSSAIGRTAAPVRRGCCGPRRRVSGPGSRPVPWRRLALGRSVGRSRRGRAARASLLGASQRFGRGRADPPSRAGDRCDELAQLEVERQHQPEQRRSPRAGRWRRVRSAAAPGSTPGTDRSGRRHARRTGPSRGSRRRPVPRRRRSPGHPGSCPSRSPPSCPGPPRSTSHRRAAGTAGASGRSRTTGAIESRHQSVRAPSPGRIRAMSVIAPSAIITVPRIERTTSGLTVAGEAGRAASPRRPARGRLRGTGSGRRRPSAGGQAQTSTTTGKTIGRRFVCSYR